MAKTLQTARTFRAVLEPDNTSLRWIVARVPFDPAEVWPVRRGRRVRGTVNGVPFRTTLFPSPAANGPVLLVNKALQKAAGARAGSTVQISIEPDLEERTAVVPKELADALKGDRTLRCWLDKLSYSARNEIGKWVTEPAGAASRLQRAERMAERLALTMDGEVEPPPILRAAFLREPLARMGWEAMTPTQRRNHLFGIFYYQTAEGRERRAAKAIEEALRAAAKARDKRA
jgi:uncharacterized protein YdeI (YjbR/CyaY-like superfamily)